MYGKYLKDEEAERLNDSIVDRYDYLKLNQIINNAKLLLGSIGIKVNPENIIFEIATKKDMNRNSKKNNIIGLAFPVSVEGEKHKIMLLENQSYIVLLSVVAHEMGHTWCWDHCMNFTKKEEEGFCELLAYHVLSTQFSKIGNYHLKLMIQNPDPIYGEGLRMMKKRFESFGESWFKFIGFLKLSKS